MAEKQLAYIWYEEITSLSPYVGLYEVTSKVTEGQQRRYKSTCIWLSVTGL